MGAFCCRVRRAYEPDSDEELLSWDGRGCTHRCLHCRKRPCIRKLGSVGPGGSQLFSTWDPNRVRWDAVGPGGSQPFSTGTLHPVWILQC